MDKRNITNQQNNQTIICYQNERTQANLVLRQAGQTNATPANLVKPRQDGMVGKWNEI
jgi:hypothetical protein